MREFIYREEALCQKRGQGDKEMGGQGDNPIDK